MYGRGFERRDIPAALSGVFLAACVLLAGGCATDVTVGSEPALLTPADSPATVRFAASAPPRLKNGHLRKGLEDGTTWERAGAIPQGTVYRPVGHVFQVYSGNVHEAYIVVSEGRLVGVFLPVERAFVPMREPVPVTLEESP